MSKWLVVATFVVGVAGCGYGSEAFTCSTSNLTQCGPGGQCDPATSLCSFADGTCTSGFRFGSLAGDHSGQCTGGTGPGSGPNNLIDAAIDAPPPPPDAQTCFGTGIVKVCLQAAPTQPYMTAGATTINTDNSNLCAPLAAGQPNFCVIAATTISIQSTMQASGKKPLVLLATDSITVSAFLDVGSHRGAAEVVGAGADAAGCDAGTKPATGGGGAGGSFTGSGGDGATAATQNSKGGLAGNTAGPVNALRGGCPGQDGDGGKNGVAGHGGGAVFLIAVNTITVGGGINAAGEGGTAGGGNTSGAGGGGSGGLIGFDAPTVTATSLLLANGGAGGQGSGANGNDPGANGADPSSTAAAKGGTNGNAVGGNGGDGSAGDAAGIGRSGSAGVNTAGFRGGGGAGGGGAGLIIAPANANLGNNVSPVVTTQQ